MTGEQMILHDKLAERNLNYRVSNRGVHFQIVGVQANVNAWPTTGRWKCDATGKTGEDMGSLLEYLDSEEFHRGR